jgi:F0F1-type ATP synthase assembly protein I
MIRQRTPQQRMASAYQGAIEAVVAFVVATLAGYGLDRWLDTHPYCFFAGIVVGFGSFVLRLWRMRGLMVEPPGGPTPPGDPKGQPDRKDGTG